MVEITGARIFRVKSVKLHPIVLELQTADGICGLGEAAVSFGFGRSACAELLREMVEAGVLGRQSDEIASIWSGLYDRSFWARGGGAIVFGALSAIEMALWDIKGKRLGIPVYDFFGGKVRNEIEVYANGWNYEFLEPMAWAKAVERPLDDGYSAVKCYPLAIPGIGGNTLIYPYMKQVDQDLLRLGRDRLALLREIVGNDVKIRVDLCGAIGLDDVIRFARMIEPLDIDWMEEAGDPADITSFAKLAERTSIPLSAGERFYGVNGFRDLIGARAISIVQPDIGTSGGLMQCLSIASMAELHGARLAPHNCGGGILTAASLHLCASVRNFFTLELFPYFSHMPGHVELVTDNPDRRVVNSKIALERKPGLGVQLDEVALEPYLWATCRLD